MAFGPFGCISSGPDLVGTIAVLASILARCQSSSNRACPSRISVILPRRWPRRWHQPNAPGVEDGYNFDGCPAEVLRENVGPERQAGLPDGMSYRLLALQESETMTPELLGRSRELPLRRDDRRRAPEKIAQPLRLPRCDVRVKNLVQESWGECDRKKVGERRLGKGRVIWGATSRRGPARGEGVPPDFLAQNPSGPAHYNYVHRSLPGAEVYFVANKTLVTQEALCTFRTSNLRPELWWPDTGQVELPALHDRGPVSWTGADELARNAPKARPPATELRMPLRLGPAGSVFVVFPHGTKPQPERSLLFLTRTARCWPRARRQSHRPLHCRMAATASP